MKASKYISRKEHKLLLYSFVLGLLLRIIELFQFVFFNENPLQHESGGNKFVMYSIFNELEMMSPIYSFSVFFISLGLIYNLSKFSIIFSLIPTVLLAYFFDSWLISSLSRLYFQYDLIIELKLSFFDVFFDNIYNLITFLLINTLLFWQISILFRMLFNTKENNELLP